MLFQISDRFLFESEFEFELEEGVTSTALEYAQVDVSLSNNFVAVAGKFLLPFNTFSERVHPTWINPFASKPPLYGGHGSVGPADPLLPVLSDVGIQLRGVYPLGGFSSITAEVFLTQGPNLVVEEHDESEPELAKAISKSGVAGALSGLGGGGEEEEDFPNVTIGSNFEDNNTDKMIGGRIGYGIAPYFEVNFSAMSGAYDDAGELRFSALGVHLESRYRKFTFHTELIRTYLEFVEHDEEGAGKILSEDALGKRNEEAVETLMRSGYYAQLGYRISKWQPMIRWTQILNGEVDGADVMAGGDQLALGVVHFLEPSLALKLEYLINKEEHEIENNRIAVQLAFGF
jgi:hypothetical protein